MIHRFARTKQWLLICILSLLLCFTACAQAEEITVSTQEIEVEQESTQQIEVEQEHADGSNVTGRVVSIEGNMVSVREMGVGMQSDRKNVKPADGEGFQGGGKFQNGAPKGNGQFSNRNVGENSEGTKPSEMPKGGTFSQKPFGNKKPGGNREPDGESTVFDLSQAQIMLEKEEGTVPASIEDISAGTFITVTLDSTGKPTTVVVSKAADYPRKNANTES